MVLYLILALMRCILHSCAENKYYPTKSKTNMAVDVLFRTPHFLPILHMGIFVYHENDMVMICIHARQPLRAEKAYSLK